MIFKVIRILLVTSFLIDFAFSATIKKCCPMNEVVEEDENSNDNFKCVSIQSHEEERRRREVDDYEDYADNSLENIPLSEEHNESTPLSNHTHQTIHHHPDFIGYNTLVDQNSHWPECGDDRKLSLKLFNEPLLKGSQSASCVDLMNEKYHIFSCDEEDEDFSEILKLKKCCPIGESYDIFGRGCVKNKVSNIDADFEDLLHDRVVIFQHELLKCKDDEALVEFHSQVHGLKIVESSLILLKGIRDFGPEVIRSNHFCIESTLNSDVDAPEGMSKEHFTNRASSKFIAKVCRNKTICNTIPCLQKCCPHGEKMSYYGEKSICEAHHLDLELKFHSFNNERSEIEPSSLVPTGEYLLQI
jgi:hypothetical protein